MRASVRVVVFVRERDELDNVCVYLHIGRLHTILLNINDYELLFTPRVPLSPSVRDAFVSSMLTKDMSSSSPSCKRWPYQDIRDVRFMRFLLEVNLHGKSETAPNSLYSLLFGVKC